MTLRLANRDTSASHEPECDYVPQVHAVFEEHHQRAHYPHAEFAVLGVGTTHAQRVGRVWAVLQQDVVHIIKLLLHFHCPEALCWAAPGAYTPHAQPATNGRVQGHFVARVERRDDVVNELPARSLVLVYKLRVGIQHIGQCRGAHHDKLLPRHWGPPALGGTVARELQGAAELHVPVVALEQLFSAPWALFFAREVGLVWHVAALAAALARERPAALPVGAQRPPDDAGVNYASDPGAPKKGILARRAPRLPVVLVDFCCSFPHGVIDIGRAGTSGDAVQDARTGTSDGADRVSSVVAHDIGHRAR
jgi:hypothetical protein